MTRPELEKSMVLYSVYLLYVDAHRGRVGVVCAAVKSVGPALVPLSSVLLLSPLAHARVPLENNGPISGLGPYPQIHSISTIGQMRGVFVSAISLRYPVLQRPDGWFPLLTEIGWWPQMLAGNVEQTLKEQRELGSELYMLIIYGSSLVMQSNIGVCLGLLVMACVSLMSRYK